MISKRDVRYERGSRFSIIKSVLFGALSVVCAASLIVYSPHHESLFYTATDAVSPESIIEYILFQLAPFLLFFLGAGAVPLCALFADCAWKHFNKRYFFDEWDHALASILLVLFTSACASALQADLFSAINPGGLVGNSILFVVRKFVGIRFEKLCIITSFFLCLMVVARHATIMVLKKMVAGVHYIISCTRLWKTFFLYGNRVCVVIVSFFQWVLRSIYSVVRGSLFEQREQEFFEIEYAGLDLDLTSDATSLPETMLEKKEEKIESISSREPEHIITKKKAEPVVDQATSYAHPNLDIFIAEKEYAEDKAVSKELEKRAFMLEQKLQRFGVSGKVTAIKRGPVVTVFEYQPSIDSKLSKIIALEDDLALALQALSIRIIAPIPGTSFVGFEVANSTRKSVQFGTIIRSESFTRSTFQLPLVIGQDTLAQPIIVDLAKMPHLLVAGSTGSGKSVALNGMLTSLLCRCSPQEMKLVLIDPKRLEFAPYADIGHLLFPIVTDVKKVAPILRYIIHEMEQRYDMMAQKGARNIFDFHAQFGKEALPFIVVIIDELADLMMTVGKDVEDLITRIAQMARAAGIHMILATQRPSVDVITGLIKVNFPSRISFRVTSKVDSRTILDVTGAEKLLGKGDMLFLDASSGAGLKRAHGAYVSDKEIQTIVAHIRTQGEPQYIDEHVLDQAITQSDEPLDDMMPEITGFLATIDEVSISLLQRKFRIGYNRSARIMEQLEQQGRILPSNGGKMRKVVH